MSRTLESEALRLAERYAVEIVEAFGLCPWAREARQTGRFHRTVIGATTSAEVVALGAPQIEVLAQRADVDVAMLIFPRLDITQSELQRLVGKLDTAHVQSAGTPIMSMAAFHPEARADLTTPDRLLPFLRRSPDSAIQLVRREALVRARKASDSGAEYVTGVRALSMMLGSAEPTGSVSDAIANHNLRTVERVGVEALETVFQDIRADRARSYASLL